MSGLISALLSVIIALSGSFAVAFSGAAAEVVKGTLALVADRQAYTEIADDDIRAIGSDEGYVKNTLLVAFDESAGLLKRLKLLRKAGAYVVGYIPEAEIAVIRVKDTTFNGLLALSEELSDDEDILFASICPAFKIENQYTPNDPFSDDGTSSGAVWNERRPSGKNWWLEAIEARAAWGYDCMLEHIDLGVVDSGFDLNHPDLYGKLEPANRKTVRRLRPSDHGCHVAGIITANRDNGIGVCGVINDATLKVVDWSSEDDQLWENEIAIFFGLGGAVKAGAKVVNFSVGQVTESGKDGGSEFLRYWEGVLYSYYMSSLLHRGYDFIAVQSSGNGNKDGSALDARWNGLFCAIDKRSAFIPFFDVKYEDLENRIIVVGNAREPDSSGVYRQSSSSNVGELVDICAPGSSIYCTYPDGQYGYMSGTSMAAPIVTAVAGTVWAAVPELDGAQVRELVLNNTKDTVEPSTSRTFDYIDYRAYPLVNVRLSLEAALREYRNAIDVDMTFDDISRPMRPAVGESVTVKAENGNEFVFETDQTGGFHCVLPEGTYGIYNAKGNNLKSVTVSK